MTKEMETMEESEREKQDKVLLELWHSRARRLLRELNSDKEIKLAVLREVRLFLVENSFESAIGYNIEQGRKSLLDLLDEAPDQDVQPQRRDPNWENIPEHIRMGL